MTEPLSQVTGVWIAGGSTSIMPPTDYWRNLVGVMPGPQLERLQQLSGCRQNEFIPSDLPPPEAIAVELLDRVAVDGWLECRQRQKCPNCEHELDEAAAAQTVCPECGEAYSQHGGVTTEKVYVRDLAPARVVGWVVAIHGMNTAGTWQEEFSWHLSTTWGRSVPVAVYKYGIIIAGVIMAWRRYKLRNDLRDKLAAFRDQARAQGISSNPDVIAHSFGTWLLGHLLKNELTRKPEKRLKFGRIILTGCILRPDFDWKGIKAAGLIEDVLNHYGNKDRIVPLAHATIWDSGPSGRRGFDGDQVINLCAEGYGHSDLFSIKKCVVNAECCSKCTGDAGEVNHLAHSYKRYWRPFLTLPTHELGRLPDRADPNMTWRQLPWPLRGTLFSFLALPLVLALGTLLIAGLGRGLWEVWKVLLIVAGMSAAGLLVLTMAATAAIAITALRRQLRR